MPFDLPLRAVCLAAAASPALALAQDDVAGRFGEYVRAIEGLAHPSDVAFAPDGTLLVAETDAHRVARVLLDGAVLARYGEGELRFPRFLAVGACGERELAVSDARGVLLMDLDGAISAERVAPRADGVDLTGPRPAIASALLGSISFIEELSAPARALGPHAVPVDVLDAGAGRMFVSDAGNHRILALDGPSFGDFGPYRGLFAEPFGLAFHEERLYVADRENHRVQVFRPDGTYLYEWGIHPLRPGEGEGALHYPTAVAISPDGEHAVVAEPSQDRLQLFRRTERPASEFVTNPVLLGTGIPAHFGTSIDAAGNVLVVAIPESRQVRVYDLREDTPIEVCTFAGYGTTPGKLRTVGGVALSRDGLRVHVSDPTSRTVQTWILKPLEGPLRMDPALARFARSIALDAVASSLRGDSPRPFVPGALAELPGGRLLVVDRTAPQLLVLDAKGGLAEIFGASSLVEPMDVEVRGAEITVLDRAAGDVSVFDLELGFLRQVRLGDHVVRAGGICALADGELLVSDAARHRVVRFPGGEAQWSGQGLGAGEMDEPAGLCADGRGRVILSDHGNHRLQVFARDGAFVDALGPRLYTLPTRRP